MSPLLTAIPIDFARNANIDAMFGVILTVSFLGLIVLAIYWPRGRSLKTPRGLAAACLVLACLLSAGALSAVGSRIAVSTDLARSAADADAASGYRNAPTLLSQPGVVLADDDTDLRHEPDRVVLVSGEGGSTTDLVRYAGEPGGSGYVVRVFRVFPGDAVSMAAVQGLLAKGGN